MILVGKMTGRIGQRIDGNIAEIRIRSSERSLAQFLPQKEILQNLSGFK